jgi:ketosteroid isomerase-like protein
MRKIVLGVCILAITVLAGVRSLPAQDAVSELKKLDEQRMKSINDGDIAAVGALLADDYVHVHNTGEVNNKAQYLVFLQTHPRKSSRAPDANVIIHVYGDVAVMVGPQINNADTDHPTAFTLTLVWRKIGGTWKQVAAQYTSLPAPNK